MIGATKLMRVIMIIRTNMLKTINRRMRELIIEE